MSNSTRYNTILAAIRPLDCGTLYCRYCTAGAHDSWKHSDTCAYRKSVREVENAKKALKELLEEAELNEALLGLTKK